VKIDGIPYRSIWVDQDDHWSVRIIDQTKLPWSVDLLKLTTAAEIAHAIVTMQVRGAPLIGASAAFGLALALRENASDETLDKTAAMLGATRPTAVNLSWAIKRMVKILHPLAPSARRDAAYAAAQAIADEDVAQNASIGRHGLDLIRAAASARPGQIVNILTHCNAGWLATVDWGTALAPIYAAHDAGLKVHVWVDETRPRNQGAFLTAFELGKHGVPHTVIADNAGGHLMQHNRVDLCIVGADRITSTGDAANKIGTYLKALAAHDNYVPFYVAAPSSTIDWTLHNGIAEIPIEERPGAEVYAMTGRALDGSLETVRIMPSSSNAANPAFDVTPARCITGIVTERGVAPANAAGLAALFPELVV
jgi:methylthioribose-1-phosphate isomerase